MENDKERSKRDATAKQKSASQKKKSQEEDRLDGGIIRIESYIEIENQGCETIEMDVDNDRKFLLQSKSAKLLPDSVYVRLRKDVYMQEQVEQVVTENNTPIGIIAHKVWTAVW